ncbi:MAG TPA: response regulator, partial [Myxococcaceae bacterium]|nr:response regulator [Myxococcaceae bacterium]
RVLGHPEWQADLTALAVYWVAAGVLAVGTIRFRWHWRVTSLAICLLDMPWVFWLQRASLPHSPSPSSVAGFTLGLFVVLVIVVSGALEGWQIAVACTVATSLEVALQRLSGVGVGTQAASAVTLAVAGAACLYSQDRAQGLLRGLVATLVEHRESAKQLLEAEVSFRTLIEALPDGVAVQRGTEVIYVNPAMAAYLRCENADSLLGRSALSQALTAGQVGGHHTRQQTLSRGDGHTVTAELYSLPLSFGSLPAVLSVTRDLSERKQLQERLLISDRTASVAAPAAGVAHEVKTLKPAPAAGGRILVVDDEPLIGAVVARALSPQHEVVRATRVDDAMSRLRAGEVFDLIFSDVTMPEAGGAELYRDVMALSEAQAAKMIFITGGAFTPEARAFLESIPNEQLIKPFDLASLVTLVQRRLGTANAPVPSPSTKLAIHLETKR